MSSKQVNETVNKLVSFMGDIQHGDLRTILANMQKMCDYQAKQIRSIPDMVFQFRRLRCILYQISTRLAMSHFEEQGIYAPPDKQYFLAKITLEIFEINTRVQLTKLCDFVNVS